MLWFGLMGALLLAFLGLLTSIWADKFDHAAAVTNFVVTPLSLLSGTFYSVNKLAPAFRAVSHANPFFYVISGFRAGFLGIGDSPFWRRRGRAARARTLRCGRLLRAAEERLEDQELARFNDLARLRKLNGSITDAFRPPQATGRSNPRINSLKKESRDA